MATLKATTINGNLTITGDIKGSYVKGDILYASDANTLTRLSIGTNGQVLKLANGVPTWGTDNNTNTTYTAGTNVQISASNVISATDTKYTAGTNMSLSGTTFSATDTKYTAGDGLTLSGNTFTPNTSYTNSGKNYKVQVDSTSKGLYVNVPWENTTYSAGTNMSLSGTTFSATDTKNTAGATDTSNTIYLVGATEQGDNPQTYTDNEVYVRNGKLDAREINTSGDVATGGNLYIYGSSATAGSLSRVRPVTGTTTLGYSGHFYTNRLYVPSLYGGTASNGEITIGSTTNATRGTINLISNTSITGNLALGTQSTKATLTYTGTTARTYTIPNVVSGDFVITSGTQTITGSKTFSSTVNIGSSANLNFQSDERMKSKHFKFDDKDILKKLSSVDIYEYNFLNKPDETKIGLMAQDLQESFPELELVENKGYNEEYGLEDSLAIKHDKLTYVLWSALKGANERIDELEERLSKLEELINKG